MKGDVFLIFVVLLVLILAIYYVGTSSDILTFAKLFQQVGYFLTGRTSTGEFANARADIPISQGSAP